MALHDPPRPQHQREAYAPIVQRFLPGCEGEELNLRCSLLLMRDRAAVRAKHCSDDAYPLLAHVERMATGRAFSSMPLDTLRETRRLCVMMFANASGLEAIAEEAERGRG